MTRQRMAPPGMPIRNLPTGPAAQMSATAPHSTPATMRAMLIRRRGSRPGPGGGGKAGGGVGGGWVGGHRGGWEAGHSGGWEAGHDGGWEAGQGDGSGGIEVMAV